MSVVSDGSVVVSDGVVTDGSDLETSTVLTTILTTVISTWATPGITVDHHSTKFPPPHNWTPPNTTTKPIRMGNTASAKQVADQVAYGIIACVTVGVLIVMVYMCIFGQRLKATGVRWHVLNCSVWGILHLISYCSFAEKAPWPNYITNQNWRDTAKQVECLTRSIFPAGMVFVYLEQIILTLAPKLANSIIFNAVFFVLLVPWLNGLMIFLYYAHYMDVVWWYEPADLFNLATYLLFVTFTFIYFLFCLFGTCLCCATMASKKQSSRTTGTFADMWLLFPYGLVPSIMYGPSFGMTSVSFAMQHLLTWVLESGLLSGGGGSSSGDSMIDMNLLMQVATNAILAMPWFVLLFPLVQSVLALVCLRMFREQFFFMVSCGRFFEGKHHKIGMTKDEWNVTSIGPPPLYPISAPSEKQEA
ncbi:hypothetical protein L5515_013073 [Caenorhabditis briggsae]|uniref:Uncharacterized protein n=1 Tax=Caenorhabditis briggsae TaxID=6238 RepID=A0AAE9E5G0_CAEBR|nr:hypothetical protein L5515_013073 [Caenorhabditis briggsae]